jgi:pyridoxamine 5'-phosphate oxidase
MAIAEANDPLELFLDWLDEAKAHPAIAEPTAMTLATVDATGMPAARIVLLKDASRAGFAFYTNLESAKGAQLRAVPRAALCFYWMPLERQVRVVGPVEPVSEAEADAYFATRGRESQLGAWASMQSRPLDSRAQLEARFSDQAARLKGRNVPRPPFWSGFRVVPESIEFWLKGPHRLNERLFYQRTDNGWHRCWLYP